MSNSNDKNKTSLMEWIKNIWAPIVLFIGATMSILSFYEAWQKNANLFVWLAGTLGYIVVLSALWHVKTSTYTYKTKIFPPQRITEPTYGVWSKPAKWLFWVWLVLGIISLSVVGWQNYQKNQVLNAKFIILVADFLGPDPENYQVTEEVIASLRSELQSYDDTNVIALKQPILEAQGGSESAYSQGEAVGADLVIWGRYSISGKDVILNIHIENLSATKELPLTSNYPSVQINKLDQMEFRVDISRELTAFTLFIAGLASYEQDDYLGAVARFTNALELRNWPDTLGNKIAVNYYRGLSYMVEASHQPFNLNSMEEFLYQANQAINDFSIVIDQTPENPDGYLYRGQVYGMLVSMQSIEVPPNTDNINKNITHSITDYTHAIELDPENFLAHLMRGSQYFKIGAVTEAIADFQAISDAPYAQYMLGNAYLMAGEESEALIAFTHAIENTSQDNFFANIYYAARGSTYHSLGDYSAALADYETARELGLIDAHYYQAIGNIYKATDDYESAFSAYDKSIASDTNPASRTYYARGILHYDMGHYEDAIADFTVLIDANFTLSDSEYHYRGLAYQKLGENQLAEADFAIAIPTLLSEGYDLYQNKNYLLAEARFTTVLEMDSSNISALLGRSRIYLIQAEYDKAFSDLNLVIEVDPSSAEAYGLRGDVFYSTSQADLAIADWEKALELSERLEDQVWAKNRLAIFGSNP